MKKNILKWLKNKKNYVFFDVNNDRFENYINRFANCLISSKIHYSDLEDSSCYLVNNSESIISIKKLKKTHHNSKFRNFNLKIQEFLFDFIFCIYIEKELSSKNAERDKDAIDLLHKVLNAKNYDEKEHLFLSKEMNYIRNILSDFIDIDLSAYFKEDNFSIIDFKERLKLIKKEYFGLSEIGIFFPFQLEHDIFENKYYLFELNQIRFDRKNYLFKKLVENFYNGYEVNTDKSKKLTTLHDYFIDYSTQYIENIAYFDPFKNYNKYEDEYGIIKKYISLKKLDFNLFINELFELLNLIQFYSVTIQQTNLIKRLRTYRSEGKQYSLRQFIEKEIKIIHKNKSNLEDREKNINLEALSLLLKVQDFTKVKVGFNIKEVPFVREINDKYLILRAQYILEEYLFALNGTSIKKLAFFKDCMQEDVKKLIKNYKLKLEHKKTINKMIDDLIFFDDNKIERDEKEIKKILSKPFTNSIEKLFEKYKKKNINTIIDYNFKEEFIKKYQKDFDCYRKKNSESETNNFIKNHIVRFDIV